MHYTRGARIEKISNAPYTFGTLEEVRNEAYSNKNKVARHEQLPLLLEAEILKPLRTLWVRARGEARDERKTAECIAENSGVLDALQVSKRHDAQPHALQRDRMEVLFSVLLLVTMEPCARNKYRSNEQNDEQGKGDDETDVAVRGAGRTL